MRTLALSWLFFLLMGLLVSIVLPLGEGFDEPWHLGYVQYVAQTGKLPPGPALHLSTDLETFLTLHPMGWRLRDIFPDLHSQEQYWQQPEPQRIQNDARIRELRFSMPYQQGQAAFSQQYESHQAPLYYVLAAPLFWLSARFLSLANTFLIIRLWSVVLASAVVPLSYLLARRVSPSSAVANGVAALVAMFPGLYPDVARVSNDALAIPLAAAVFLALAYYLDSHSTRHAIVLGVLMLAALSTKAVFIPVLLAIALALFCLRDIRGVAIIAVASAPGWAWYVRNLLITGSMTGLPETVSARTTVVSSIGSLAQIHWMDVLHLAAASHIWIGNWSLLQYRGWIYQTILVLYAIGVAGFIAYLSKTRTKTVVVLLVIYAFFASSLVYYATQVFQQTGIPVIQGWYLSPLIPVETLAFVLGIRFVFSGRVLSLSTAIVATCFLAMLIYGNLFIAAPYYTGLIEHAQSGNLRSYHPQWADIAVMGKRLTRFHPWIPYRWPPVLSIIVFLTGFSVIWSLWKEHAL